MTKFRKSSHHFKSKTDGFKAAKRFHACLDCRHSQPKTYKECPGCGSTNRQFFSSATEHKRGMLLLTLLQAGTIERLRFQPQYALKVNGVHICSYRADAEYYKEGCLVVEDSKAEKTDFIDPVSKIKMALFSAVYGIEVFIPQRKNNGGGK